MVAVAWWCPEDIGLWDRRNDEQEITKMEDGGVPGEMQDSHRVVWKTGTSTGAKEVRWLAGQSSG